MGLHWGVTNDTWEFSRGGKGFDVLIKATYLSFELVLDIAGCCWWWILLGKSRVKCYVSTYFPILSCFLAANILIEYLSRSVRICQ